ncbi:Hypothetical predicted protein [Octopus vulgaris]|uniref:Uncharacterized protein n=1 Tax=Octopus vulgaris TaxID=6645 RepID=A0AA36FDK2_OCTVU|nr:Hypothetical predicted protein [Octopus vulgaris]
MYDKRVSKVLLFTSGNRLTDTKEKCSVKSIAGEIEFFADLQLSLDGGKIMSTIEVEKFYKECMNDHVTDLRLVDIPKSLLDIQETNVTGRPTPYQSPHYPDFQLGQYEESKAAKEIDLAWLLARHFNRQKCGTRNLQDCEFETYVSSEADQPTIESEDIEVTTEEFNDNSKLDLKKQDIPLWRA